MTSNTRTGVLPTLKSRRHAVLNRCGDHFTLNLQVFMGGKGYSSTEDGFTVVVRNFKNLWDCLISVGGHFSFEGDRYLIEGGILKVQQEDTFGNRYWQEATGHIFRS